MLKKQYRSTTRALLLDITKQTGIHGSHIISNITRLSCAWVVGMLLWNIS